MMSTRLEAEQFGERLGTRLWQELAVISAELEAEHPLGSNMTEIVDAVLSTMVHLASDIEYAVRDGPARRNGSVGRSRSEQILTAVPVIVPSFSSVFREFTLR
jgi:hypothetical protein